MNTEMNEFQIVVAQEEHIPFIPDILDAIYEASLVPGNSIVMRDPDYLASKMREGKAVIALCNNAFAGFCYIESWQNGEFVANSGLIVKPEFRGQGLASRIKAKIVEVCQHMFPRANLFGITKSATVIRMNERLGFQQVPYTDITNDPAFWKGCDTCRHYEELLQNEGKNCRCIALLLRPKEA